MFFKTAATFTLLAGLALAPGAAAPEPPSLRLLARAPLPPARSIATDIRWAGDDSVYVSWYRDGVAELGLDGVKRHALAPDSKALGGVQHYDHLAVSSGELAVASQAWAFARRPLKAKRGGQVEFKTEGFRETTDFDLDPSGGKILFLGLPRGGEPYAPRGEVAWFGSAHGPIESLSPVLRDVGGDGAPNYWSCGTYDVGAVRFLADGSFVVAPGFQDGVHLFDAGGRRIRSWTNREIGLDTHTRCASMTKEEERKFRLDDDYLRQWVNGHHLLDEILPLPQGPGLLVRYQGRDGQAHWQLKILGERGISTYTLPVVGRRPFDRLHGDVRNGRIVLLRSSSGLSTSTDPADGEAELLLLDVPKG